MSTVNHWEQTYRTTAGARRSWFEEVPRASLRAIQETEAPPGAGILDVGGGASLLVDHLLALGYRDLTVLDLAPSALAESRQRLGPAAGQVSWIAGDILAFTPTRRYAIWHDRAVLHFLRSEAEQERYASVLRRTLAPTGHVILATFGPEGPERCSGLAVRRHSTESLAALLGPAFELRASALELHRTPAGDAQQFLHTRWRARDTTARA